MKLRPPLAQLPALLVLIELLSCARPAPGATVTNIVRSFPSNSFEPVSRSINVGDTVVWVWESGVHNVTFPTNGIASANLSPGGTFTTTFNTPGTFAYVCTLHFGQTGTITVQAVNQPPSVSLTAPANASSVLATTNLLISATATDADGSVTSVQFFSLTNATLVAGSPLAGAAVFTVSNSFTGQQYVVDALTNFTGTLSTRWFPIATNTAPSNNFIFTDGVLTTPVPRLYRIRQAL